jgi:hypothetical protein
MTADSICHEIWSKADWSNIEIDKNLILSTMKDNPSGYFIRLGDGELSILHKQEELGYMLANSVDNCSLLGLPEHYSGYTHMWKPQIISNLQKYNVDVSNKPTVSAIFPLFVPSVIGNLINGKSTIWITNNSSIIIKNLTKRRFCEFYGICYGGLHTSIQVPAGRTLPYSKQTPIDVYNKICDEIITKEFDIAVLGVGMIGKLLAQFISQTVKKPAIDAGCILSAMRGFGNDRVIFQQELKDIVWHNQVANL